MKTTRPRKIISIDPGRTIGLAWTPDGGTTINHESIHLLAVAKRISEIMSELAADKSKEKIHVCIEWIPSGMKGGAQVLFVGTTLAEWLTKTFPRMLQIHKLNPTKWQADMKRVMIREGIEWKNKEPKTNSLLFAKSKLGHEVQTDHESDAVCMLLYLVRQYPE